MMLAPHSARRVATRRAEWARRSWSALLRHSSDSVAAPSQQRCAQHQLRRSSISSTRRADWARRSWSAHLRRSSVAAALRAASAPSQQHQLRRGRDAQNERDGAGLRSSVAAATPSQQRLRRSSVAAALRAASAPSQQHQLRRGRDAQNERDGAGLRSSYKS